MVRRWGLPVSFALMACAAPGFAKTAFPPNVTVAKDKTLERVDWSFDTAQPVEFARIKRCVATNVRSDDVQLRDSAGSWVGPATGNYYQQDNRAVAQGKGLFKFVDEGLKVLIANGQTDRTSGLSGWIIRYELEAGIEGNRVLLNMRNIQLAASNTGVVANDGFRPLGTWFRFKSNYAALESDATRVKTCIIS